MAQVQEIRMIDDLDGTEDGVSNVEFAIDGKHYEIDLSGPNASRLREAVAPFVAGARRAGKSLARVTGAKMTVSRAGRSREESADIREWGRGNGFPNLSDRGRIPAPVLVAYDQAKGKTTVRIASSTPETAPTPVAVTTEPNSPTTDRPAVSGTDSDTLGSGTSTPDPSMQAMVAFRESRSLPVPKSKKLSGPKQLETRELMAKAGLL